MKTRASEGVTTLLVLGGARSGKSRYAEGRLHQVSQTPIYMATAQAFDSEMEDRIARHRLDRGPSWRTIEAPIDLPDAMAVETPTSAILVDCLTLWVSNLLLSGVDIPCATDRLTDVIRSRPGPTALVSNEVGLGIVPDNALARQFRDAAGQVNQIMAALCDEVVFVAAGLPLILKGPIDGR